MIIWRGWGILGVLIALLGAVIGLGVGNMIGGGAVAVCIGLGLAAGGVGAHFVGKHLNVASVDQKVEGHLAQRRAELDHLVQSGQFQLAPGVPVASSEAEARAQADQVLAGEREHLAPRLRNQHTLFFVPLQYAAFGIVALGLVIAALTAFAAITA
ncbi:MAG: hypothetical protein ACTH2Q_14680 [Propionibacteriaceae bacterium]